MSEPVDTAATAPVEVDPRPGAGSAQVWEVVTKDAVLVLDGRVIEVFLRSAALSRRWHVTQVRIDAKPSRKGRDFTYTIGADRGSVITDGLTFVVPLERHDEVRSLVAEAVRRRDV